MKENNFSETDPGQTKELSTGQETQPMDVEAIDEQAKHIERPGDDEPLPSTLGDESAVDVKREETSEVEVDLPEAPQVLEEAITGKEADTSVAATAPASPKAASQPVMITRSAALWLAAGGMLITFFFAVLFTLGLLAIINGGLRYAQPGQVQSLSGQLNGLNAQAVSIQRELDNLTTRVNTLEGLDARLVSIEKDTQLLQEAAKATSTAMSNLDSRVGELSGQVAAVGGQIEELNNRSARFQRFLDGLRDLLGSLSQP